MSVSRVERRNASRSLSPSANRREARRANEGLDLPAFQPARGSRLEPAKVKRPELNANEPMDGEPRGAGHDADLPLLALEELDPKHALARGDPFEERAMRREEPALVANPRAKRAQDRGIGDRRDQHAIDPGHARPRMEERFGQSAIVGQEQEPLRLEVQPSDGMKPPRLQAQLVVDGALSA